MKPPWRGSVRYMAGDGTPPKPEAPLFVLASLRQQGGLVRPVYRCGAHFLRAAWLCFSARRWGGAAGTALPPFTRVYMKAPERRSGLKTARTPLWRAFYRDGSGKAPDFCGKRKKDRLDKAYGFPYNLYCRVMGFSIPESVSPSGPGTRAGLVTI